MMTLSFEVAHHLKLVLLPAKNGFFNQALVNGREIEAAGENLHQFFAVVSNAAAGPPSVKDGRMMTGNPIFASELEAIFQIVHKSRARHVEANLLHRVFEEKAVFGLLDGRDVGANEVHVVLVEDASVGEVDGKVERGLSSNRGQHSESRVARDISRSMRE